MSSVAEIYSSMTDNDLFKLAVFEPYDIEENFFPILINELGKRSYGFNVCKLVKEIRSRYNEDSIQQLAYKYMSSTCPICGKSNSINALVFHTFYGFVLFNFSEHKLTIGCNDCLRRIYRESIKNNLLFSIPGFPLSSFNVPWYLFKNKKEMDNISNLKPSKELILFVKKNFGNLFYNIYGKEYFSTNI
jgi:hypothetical protein